MTAAELTDWVAFERVYGPVLIHERIEAGFALLTLWMAKLWTGKTLRPADVLPRWDREAADPDSVWAGFQSLLAMAKPNGDG